MAFPGLLKFKAQPKAVPHCVVLSVPKAKIM
nr:MAG TPA: hypothetical protein [Caudoviricetes sp.]